MPHVTTDDGVDIFYKDWGTGQPIVFSHGWPLSADAWDPQMMYFLAHGYRVIAHDRRGHGRSEQVADGHDMDHYADDLAALVRHLDLRDAIHVGHSTGGGEVARYLSRHGTARASKAVLLSAVTPGLTRSENNPHGQPVAMYDLFQQQVAENRATAYRHAAIPFYGYDLPGVMPSHPVLDNHWRQAMMGSVKAHHDCIVAFSKTDFTADLPAIDVPALVLHGGADQVAPARITAERAAALLPDATLKIYPGFPHGMPIIKGAVIDPDLLEFFRD
ncbi:alpha/beta fold hydrolase [Tsukamurella sp. 1534]|uniref:alpha/beta fold hydrolase n=1 Tax=Tsukamurella sp. 1534 TaxID=1151061 RepID=UPI0002E9D0A9|nr:alpha/beta hydrolase [Tsukamurella sp. 1534]